MKKILFSTLIIAISLCALVGTTGCKNEYKDMVPGEVRLKENNYRNDDKIQDITYATAAGKDTTMSAIELRTIWHAVIINAEKNFENRNADTKNTYQSPVQAEEAFSQQMDNSLALMCEKYPDSHTPLLQELLRANVHAYIKYVWCAGKEEYVDLKFEVEPYIEAIASNTAEK